MGGATYYVDVERGSDNNAGTSEDSALQSIAAACDKPDAGTVRVKGYGIDKPYYRGGRGGFNNRTQSRPINIIGYGPLLPYVTTHDVLTFAPCPGKANVYQTTRPSVTECMDMAGGAPGTRMTKTTSLEACEASPGSWYQSGTALFVHAINSRNLSSNGASRIWHCSTSRISRASVITPAIWRTSFCTGGVSTASMPADRHRLAGRWCWSTWRQACRKRVEGTIFQHEASTRFSRVVEQLARVATATTITRITARFPMSSR